MLRTSFSCLVMYFCSIGAVAQAQPLDCYNSDGWGVQSHVELEGGKTLVTFSAFGSGLPFDLVIAECAHGRALFVQTAVLPLEVQGNMMWGTEALMRMARTSTLEELSVMYAENGVDSHVSVLAEDDCICQSEGDS